MRTALRARPGFDPRTGLEVRDDGTGRGEGDGEGGGAEGFREIRAAIDGFTATADERFRAIEGGMVEMRSRLDGAERVLRRPGAGQDDAERRNQAGELETRAFWNFVRHGREAMVAEEVRALQAGVNTAGGYLAPAQFSTELIRNLVLFSPVRAAARVSQTAQGEVILPRRTGALTATWTAENADRTETGPTYGQISVPINEAACYVDVSNSLLEDAAFDIAAELAVDFAEEFGRLEGAAFVNGDSILKPLGFMQDSSVGSVVSGNASQITFDGLVDLLHAVPTAYASSGVWGMNRSTMGTLRKIKDGEGNYIWKDPIAGVSGQPMATIFGRPVIEMPDMPDIGANNYPVVFGDFRSAYRIFDRVVLSVLRDPYSVQTKGLVRFHARRRVGGGVQKAEAIKKLKIAAS